MIIMFNKELCKYHTNYQSPIDVAIKKMKQARLLAVF